MSNLINAHADVDRELSTTKNHNGINFHRNNEEISMVYVHTVLDDNITYSIGTKYMDGDRHKYKVCHTYSNRMKLWKTLYMNNMNKMQYKPYTIVLIYSGD